MYRSLLPTLVKAQRDGQIEKGRKRTLDEGEDVELVVRIRSPELLSDAWWDQYQHPRRSAGGLLWKQHLPRESPSFLIVKPLLKLPTTQPPNSSTPWHISLSFYDKARRADFEKLERQFNVPKKMTLKGRLYGISFYLVYESDPIATNPLVSAVHAADPWYHVRQLHVSL